MKTPKSSESGEVRLGRFEVASLRQRPLKASFLARDPATGVLHETLVVLFAPDSPPPDLMEHGWQVVALAADLCLAHRLTSA